MQNNSILSLENVSKYFYTSSNFFRKNEYFAALNNVSLNIASGSYF